MESNIKGLCSTGRSGTREPPPPVWSGGGSCCEAGSLLQRRLAGTVDPAVGGPGGGGGYPGPATWPLSVRVGRGLRGGTRGGETVRCVRRKAEFRRECWTLYEQKKKQYQPVALEMKGRPN